MGITAKVEVDNLFLSIAQDVLQWALQFLLYHLLYVVVLGIFLHVACKIHEGYIEGKFMEGHASELSVQLWNDLVRALAMSVDTEMIFWASP